MRKCLCWHIKVRHNICFVFVIVDLLFTIESFFENVPSPSQTPVNFGMRMSPIVAPSRFFIGEVEWESNTIPGPSQEGLGGKGVGRRVMPPTLGRMVVCPSPMVPFP